MKSPPKPILIQGKAEVEAPLSLVTLCHEAWLLKKTIDAASEEFKVKKAQIAAALEDEGTVIVPGEYRVTCSRRTTFSIANVDGLLEALGGARFGDLVDTKESFSATKKLLAIADDPAHPDHDAVLACLASATTTTVALKPEAA